MTGRDPYELDDVWVNALAAFPDVEPLARLLRSNAPMTAGARDLLAELLVPGDPPIERFILRPEVNKNFDKTLRKLGTVANYKMETHAGTSSDVAAEKAGANHHVGPRQAFRHLAEKIPERLGARLRGRDTEED